MKTTRRTWMRVAMVPCLLLLTACPFSAPQNPQNPENPQHPPASPAPKEGNALGYVELLRISPGGELFQAQLTDLAAQKVVYQSSGQGPAALEDYRKKAGSLAPADRVFRITVPLGSAQATTPQQPPCPKGDEPVWTRFSMQAAGHYMAALAAAGEKLPEQLSFMEVLQIDPSTQDFTGQTVEVYSGQIVHQGKGGKGDLQGYEQKLGSIAPPGRRVRIAVPFSDRVAGSVPMNPPIPPGPTGQDRAMSRFVIRTLSDYNGAKAEGIMESLPPQ